MIARSNGPTVLLLLNPTEATLLAGIFAWISGGDDPNATAKLAADGFRELQACLNLGDDADLPNPFTAMPVATKTARVP